MKVTKTFSIEKDLYEKFDDICRTKNVNRSSFLETCIKSFVVDNFKVDMNISYKLKVDSAENYVKIVAKSDNYLILDNGNKIDIQDFEKIYEQVDSYVKSVVNAINKEIDVDDVEQVDPEILNQPLTDYNLIKQIIDNVDLDKMKYGEFKERFEKIKSVFDREDQ